MRHFELHMRGLSGDFTTMPLKDLVVYLWNRQATGQLTLEYQSIHKEVLLDQGQLYNASSNLPREYLGQYLINLGHLSEEELDKAYLTQKETKVFLGRILEMIGAVSTDTLRTVLTTKFKETLLEAFNWPEGTFKFELDKKPPQPDGLQVRVPLSDLHKEADFRVHAWTLMRQAFPSGDVRLTLHRDQLVESPKPGSIDDKIFRGIEQGHTIDELALQLHATDYFLYNRLYAYLHMGAVSVDEAAASNTAEPGADLGLGVDLGLGDSPTAAQLLEHSQAFFEKSNFRDAYALAKRSNELTPTLEATLALRKIESVWTPQLKADLLAGATAPTLLIGPQQLQKLTLSAAERYLFSRIDGKRDVETILRIAPLPQFEALVAFDRFIAQRWVRL